ncbi:MAG: hypothetical protein ACT4QG_09305 [Sporichthyaceae bacterium]
MPHALHLSKAALAAWHALLVAAEHTRPPCRGRTEWVSDDPADKAAAIEACGWCPLTPDCRAFTTAWTPTAGVWHGRDFTEANNRRHRERAP